MKFAVMALSRRVGGQWVLRGEVEEVTDMTEVSRNDGTCAEQYSLALFDVTMTLDSVCC
jgi:hypothetical protein